MRILATFASMMLVACASTGVSEDFEFDASSPKGLIVFGFSADVGAVDFAVARYNAANGTVSLGVAGGAKSITHKEGQTQRYYVLDLNAGDYVFHSASVTQSGYPTTYVYVTCLADSTYQFQVKPGEILYVGNFRYEGRLRSFGQVLKFVGFAEDNEVRTALATFPRVQGDYSRAELEPTTFPRGRDLFGMKEGCGGYYQKGKAAAEDGSTGKN